MGERLAGTGPLAGGPVPALFTEPPRRSVLGSPYPGSCRAEVPTGQKCRAGLPLLDLGYLHVVVLHRCFEKDGMTSLFRMDSGHRAHQAPRYLERRFMTWITNSTSQTRVCLRESG
jgi:hypothetical protein